MSFCMASLLPKYPRSNLSNMHNIYQRRRRQIFDFFSYISSSLISTGLMNRGVTHSRWLYNGQRGKIKWILEPNTTKHEHNCSGNDQQLFYCKLFVIYWSVPATFCFCLDFVDAIYFVIRSSWENKYFVPICVSRKTFKKKDVCGIHQ